MLHLRMKYSKSNKVVITTKSRIENAIIRTSCDVGCIVFFPVLSFF